MDELDDDGATDRPWSVYFASGRFACGADPNVSLWSHPKRREGSARIALSTTWTTKDDGLALAGLRCVGFGE